jgi:glutathione reductase (NADPH)
MSLYDLIILGAGSGGIATAIRAARHGAKVALLEPRELGGTCVNVGCVPKKAMWLASKLARAQDDAKRAGFAVTPGALDWSRFIALRDSYIQRIHASYAEKLANCGVELIAEAGRFIGERRIATASRELEAKHVVIATGARPHIPEVPGAEWGIDSDGFFALRDRPRRVAIVGGGYIATELAGILNALGSEVSLFVRDDRLLKPFDREVTEELDHLLRAHGITLRYSARVESLRRDGDGAVVPRINGDESEGSFDQLIWATGRIPNTQSLRLSELGIQTSDRGHVFVDERQDTNISGVHAIGDVTGKLALTPVATASGRLLANRLFAVEHNARMDFENVPTVVFAPSPLATVGLSEEAAREQFGSSVHVYHTRFRPMLNALTQRDEKTFMKLVCVGDDERIAGIHVLGEGADEMLQGFAVAVKMGARKRDFEATVAIHPSAAEEIVLMAAPARR